MVISAVHVHIFPLIIIFKKKFKKQEFITLLDILLHILFLWRLCLL